MSTSTSGHPDFDALSAHHDGEAPEWGPHVADCAECRGTLYWLRMTTALVASPVPPVAADVRDAALARALDAFVDAESVGETTKRDVRDEPAAPVPSAPVVSLPERRAERATPALPREPGAINSGRPQPRTRGRGGSGLWVGLGSAAAVLLAFVVGVGVLAGGSGDDEGGTVTAAGPPAAQERVSNGLVGDSIDAMGGAGSGLQAPTADTAGGISAGDLGDIADAPTLVARAQPGLARRGTAEASVTDAGSPAPAPTVAATAADLTPKVAGTRPCEMEARITRPDLGTVVYFATVRVAGVPAVVLGFAPGPAPAPVTLLALAQQEGCRTVLEAVAP